MDGLTNGPTNQRTNKSAYREACIRGLSLLPNLRKAKNYFMTVNEKKKGFSRIQKENPAIMNPQIVDNSSVVDLDSDLELVSWHLVYIIFVLATPDFRQTAMLNFFKSVIARFFCTIHCWIAAVIKNILPLSYFLYYLNICLVLTSSCQKKKKKKKRGSWWKQFKTF